MIKFIDLRGSDTGKRFAFLDTVTNKFVRIAGSQAWNTWDEISPYFKDFENDDYFLERFKALCPEWVFQVSCTPSVSPPTAFNPPIVGSIMGS